MWGDSANSAVICMHWVSCRARRWNKCASLGGCVDCHGMGTPFAVPFCAPKRARHTLEQRSTVRSTVSNCEASPDLSLVWRLLCGARALPPCMWRKCPIRATKFRQGVQLSVRLQPCQWHCQSTLTCLPYVRRLGHL